MPCVSQSRPWRTHGIEWSCPSLAQHSQDSGEVGQSTSRLRWRLDSNLKRTTMQLCCRYVWRSEASPTIKIESSTHMHGSNYQAMFIRVAHAKSSWSGQVSLRAYDSQVLPRHLVICKSCPPLMPCLMLQLRLDTALSSSWQMDKAMLTQNCQLPKRRQEMESDWIRLKRWKDNENIWKNIQNLSKHLDRQPSTAQAWPLCQSSNRSSGSVTIPDLGTPLSETAPGILQELQKPYRVCWWCDWLKGVICNLSKEPGVVLQLKFLTLS